MSLYSCKKTLLGGSSAAINIINCTNSSIVDSTTVLKGDVNTNSCRSTWLAVAVPTEAFLRHGSMDLGMGPSWIVTHGLLMGPNVFKILKWI